MHIHIPEGILYIGGIILKERLRDYVYGKRLKVHCPVIDKIIIKKQKKNEQTKTVKDYNAGSI
jgi:hypothetical protein